ncbi:hypothetical protein AB0M39_38030 [Streptomyces sp. NPDC051907]|uniref:hypothetical protein n=1 Tax=Streptomyces sp. NPDC051907 TaxID=3155284 RepID=UPI003421068F
MKPHLIVICAAFGFQFALLALGFWTRRVPTLDFCKLSGILMCMVTGAPKEPS